MSAPRPRPTAIATGRLRPARPGLAVGVSVMSAGSSDLEQLCFLVLERLVGLLDVLVRDLLELLLGARDVVLADLTVASELVERLLRVPADVADGHPALL